MGSQHHFFPPKFSPGFLVIAFPESVPAGFWIRFYPWEALVQDLESRRATEVIIAPAGRFMGFNRWSYRKSCQELPRILHTSHLEAAGSCRPIGSRGLWACPASLPKRQQGLSLISVVPTCNCFHRFCKLFNHFIKFVLTSALRPCVFYPESGFTTLIFFSWEIFYLMCDLQFVSFSKIVNVFNENEWNHWH